MKTGRVRKKEGATPEPEKQPAQESPPAKKLTSQARPQPVGIQRKQPKPPYLILGIMAAIFVCFIVFVAIMTLRSGADEWVEATRVNGAWTATVNVLGPQVQIQEMWETECVNLPNGTVRFGTCILQDAKTYQDRVVDDYEEYAYNIYYEETTAQPYQAQGANFTATTLGSDSWTENNLFYTRQEELDKESCDYTNYTVWIDDPQDKSLQAEVYLSECEVWDHIVVKERIYDQKSWCQCDVTALVQIGFQSEQGIGMDVQWPNPIVPAGGRAEQSFKGQVTFLGDDYTYTTTTDDVARYHDYMTSQYYIGLKDGKPIKVSKNPKN